MSSVDRRGPRFKTLARAMVGLNRWVVISEREDGKINLATQVEAETDEGKKRVFLKDPLVMDASGFENLYAAMGTAKQRLNRASDGV